MKKIKSVILITLFASMAVLRINAQGYLHASGTLIKDGAGNEVILRGIGTGNWMIQEGYMMQTSGVAGTQHEFRNKLVSTIGEEKTDSFYTVWLDSNYRRIDADSMKAWGFNSLRVAMHYKWFTPPIEEEPVPGEITWMDKGFTMIDSLLDWCGDNQMYLILDLHGAPGGQGNDTNISDGDPSKPNLWQSQANKDKTVALWRKLAERYSTEPWIGGYDLINETNWTFPEGNNSQLKALFVSITNAIREVDPNHLIFIEGNSWANDYSGLTPAWDANMAYSFHKYWNDYTQASLKFATDIRSSTNRPIWLGESGENSNTWFTATIKLCEANHIGWSWWPVKKAGTSNPINVSVNSDYTQLVNYWKGSAANPGVDNAFNAVLKWATNQKLENCRIQKDVIDAMFRQTKSSETIPYTLYHTGDTIFTVNYNLGKNGYAYFDNDTVNVGGAKTVWNQGYAYRNDGVDIEGCTDTDASNGYNVGWTETGEWMEYTVVVDSTAGYTLSIRSASGSSGSKVHLEENGTAVSSGVTLAGTGGWQTWKTTQVTGIILSKGMHKLRLVFDQGGSNMNYFKLSDPVAVDELPFVDLLNESSVDGSYILVNLNKPVTGGLDELNLTDFTVTIGSTIVEVTGITPLDRSPNVLAIALAEPLYYGGLIKISYQGTALTSGAQALTQFSTASVVNNLPFRFTLPAVLQAENYSYNFGMSSETCSDAGTGLDMGYANAGDYLDYFVYVPQPRYYTISFRVASSVSGTQIILRKVDGKIITDKGTLDIASTGGWQTWKTLSLTDVFLEAGRYTLRMYIKQGQFNINWIQAAASAGVAVNQEKAGELLIYPNPAKDFVTVEFPGERCSDAEINIYNALGRVVKSVRTTGENQIQIGTSELEKGIYYIVIKSKEALPSTFRIIIM